MPAAAAQNAYLKYGLAYAQDRPSRTKESLANSTRWQWSFQQKLASEMARHPELTRKGLRAHFYTSVTTWLRAK